MGHHTLTSGGIITHYGFLTPYYSGYIFIACGLAFLIYGIIGKIKKDRHGNAAWLCTLCESPYRAKDQADGICPRCGGKLEDVVGFYGRHPELADGGHPELKESINRSASLAVPRRPTINFFPSGREALKTILMAILGMLIALGIIILLVSLAILLVKLFAGNEIVL